LQFRLAGYSRDFDAEIPAQAHFRNRRGFTLHTELLATPGVSFPQCVVLRHDRMQASTPLVDETWLIQDVPRNRHHNQPVIRQEFEFRFLHRREASALVTSNLTDESVAFPDKRKSSIKSQGSPLFQQISCRRDARLPGVSVPAHRL
jgi:hypothetical protein